MDIIIALIPILFLLILLFFVKLSALKSSILALVITCVITIFYHSYALNREGILNATTHGMLIAFIAAYVLFFGLLLYQLLDSVNGIQLISDYLTELTEDKILQMLILITGFSPLLESTSGFGIAFMIIAPLLLSIGFSPYKAIMIALVSLLAVPWGALATGTVIGAELAQISLINLGVGTSILSLPVFFYFIFLALMIAGGKAALKEKWLEATIFSVIFAVGIFIFNKYLSVELSGVLTALIEILVGFVIIHRKKYKSAKTKSLKPKAVIKIFIPYAFLTLSIFVSRTVTPIKEVLKNHLVIQVEKYNFRLELLYSPAFWLFLTCILTVLIYRISTKNVFIALKISFDKWVPFFISTTAFIGISQIMDASGMIQIIGREVGEAFNKYYFIVVPLLGGLGGFLTGSNTGSNAMFMKLQTEVATKVQIQANLTAYLQNASSSQATMANPARISLGTSLCNAKNEEVIRILRNMTLIVLGSIALLWISSFLFLLSI